MPSPPSPSRRRPLAHPPPRGRAARAQRSWAEDADKLTFIVLDRSLPDTPGTGTHGGAMAGDVNLFFGDEDDRSVAEIEVMVAEPASRRKGLAREALRLLVAYSAARLGVRCYVAKIRDHNEASMRLFEGLGFREVRRVAVFKEVHYELYVGEMGAGVAAASAGGAGAEGEGEGERGGPGGEGGGEPAPPPPPAWVAEEVAALKCTTYEGG